MCAINPTSPMLNPLTKERTKLAAISLRPLMGQKIVQKSNCCFLGAEMDPGGYFRGSTVHASWQEVKDAHAYSVSIDQCDADSICNQVSLRVILWLSIFEQSLSLGINSRT